MSEEIVKEPLDPTEPVKHDDTELGENEEEEDALASSFDLHVDPDQDYRATQLKICSFKRPHMRAFHCSWWSFFIAFFIWFSIAPLLPEVRETLGLTKQEIWITNISAVFADIGFRFLFGSLCDKFGARILMGLVLMMASVPTACTGLVNSLAGLTILRLFIGLAGSCFVMCQSWSSRMFTKEIAGTANALVGGWGNVGGGVTQIVMGSLLYPLFRDVFFDGDSEKAWRTVCIVPAIVAFATGVLVIMFSDDAPTGNFKELKRQGKMQNVSASASFRTGAINFNTWLLYFQYGCCFGVELTMNNAAASYFHDEFGLDIAIASAIASVFGFMNIFARGLGGFASDKMNAKMGMKGRIWAQFILLFAEGVCIIIFALLDELWAVILMLTIFSIFVQGAEGSTYGIVPYVEPVATGSVSGIVGSGGPSGAVSFGMAFLFLSNITHAYLVMGSVVLFSSFFCFAMNIKGHGGIFFTSSSPEGGNLKLDVVEEAPDMDAARDDKEDDSEIMEIEA